MQVNPYVTNNLVTCKMYLFLSCCLMIFFTVHTKQGFLNFSVVLWQIQF